MTEYNKKVGEVFLLQGQLYDINKRFAERQNEVDKLRKQTFDKAVIKYIESPNTDKCMSSTKFVQLYNSTIPTSATTN